MQKYLAIGRGVKILDQKNRGGGGFNEPPRPASLRVKDKDRQELRVGAVYKMQKQN